MSILQYIAPASNTNLKITLYVKTCIFTTNNIVQLSRFTT